MGKNIGIILILLFASKAYGITFFNELFEGFQDSAEYKSSIPCESEKKDHCSAVQGPLGKALDQASQMGLNIQNILIKSEGQNDNAVFVQTENQGTCYVNPNNKTGLKFTCSQKGLVNTRLASVDRIIVLTKRDEQFALKDVTQTQSFN